jgi:hypothetical protein
MIDAATFARPVLKPGNLPFGLADGADIAAVLRRFADVIAGGDVVVTKVQCGSVASAAEWSASGLFIEYVARVD